MNGSRMDNEMLAALLRSQDDLTRALNPRGAQAREHVSSRIWSPLVDVYEDVDQIIIRADLPGMRQEEIDVEMSNETLTLRGERKFEGGDQQEGYVRVERQYGPFQRSFTVGVPIEGDKVKASYRNGVLELVLPKAEVTKPKKVQVSVE